MYKQILVLLTLFSFLVFPSQAQAKVVMQESGVYTIHDGEIVDDDLFIGAENVNIDGDVMGDVFVGAGTVRVSGSIKGGLFVGTGDLSLSGATIGNSVVAGAGSVSLDADTTIGGSLVVGTGDLKNSATVGRSILAGAGTVYLDGKVGKEVRVGGGSIVLGSSADIAGNLLYALGEETDNISQDPSATVGGTISRYTPPVNARQDMEKAKKDMTLLGAIAGRGWLLISFVGSLILGFLILKLFPKTTLGLSAFVTSSLLPSLGTGFLIVVAAVPVFLVLALTIIGLPILGVLIPLFCIELHLAKLVASYALGHFVARQFSWNKMGIYAIFSVGLAIFYLVRAIPGIGGITSILFTWAGLGASWLYTRSHLKSL